MESVNLEVLKAALARALTSEGLDPSALDPGTLAEVRALLAARQSLPPILQTESLGEALRLADAPFELPWQGMLLAGRYRLEQRLASTSHSIVFLAADERLADNRVVVKFLHHSRMRLATVRNLVRNEIEALARLRHPGVAGLIDAGKSEGGTDFVVMQYMPGRSLRDIIDQGAVTPSLARAVVEQVGVTLDAAHRAGIVHCDLKPGNIIVDTSRDDDIRVYVVDFGIASTRSEPLSGSLGGTAAYAAPEQFRGEASPRSDVYALAKITAELYPRASGELRRTIVGGHSAEPLHRHATPGVFARAVTSALDRQRRRPKLFLGAASAVLLALLAFLRGSAPKQASSSPFLRPITSLKGVELDPNFSFDGRRILYSHGMGQNEPRRIFVTDIAHPAPKQLTFGPGMDRRPAISSDGESVAYINVDGTRPAQIRIVSGDGRIRTIHSGDIQSLSFGPNPRVLYWTEWLAPALSGAIRRVDLDTGRIDTYLPPPNSKGDIDISVSPDGRTLAFVRYESSEIGELHTVALDQDGRLRGTPFRVTSLRRRIFHPVWYPSGDRLLFVAGSLTNRTLWKARIGPGGRSEVEELTEFGDQIEEVAISRRGQLALVRNKEDADIWEFPLRTHGVADPSSHPRRAFSSTALDEEPRFSWDGRRVAFFSERSGQLQAWMAGVSQPVPTRLTDFRRIEKAWLSWTPTGALSVFAHIPGVGPELHRLAPGSPGFQRVFAAPRQQRVIGLSTDGRSLYVTPDGESGQRLERWWIDSGKKELVAQVEAGFLRESPDGAWLYYTRRRASAGLFRMRRGGGEEQQVVPNLSRRNTFALRNGWLYYASSTPEMGIYAIRLSDNFQTRLFSLDRLPGWGMDVSPDGRRLLMPVYHSDDADIHLADRLPQ